MKWTALTHTCDSGWCALDWDPGGMWVANTKNMKEKKLSKLLSHLSGLLSDLNSVFSTESRHGVTNQALTRAAPGASVGLYCSSRTTEVVSA